MYLVEPQTCSYVLGVCRVNNLFAKLPFCFQQVESPLFCNLIDYTDENGIPDQNKLFKSVEEQ